MSKEIGTEKADETTLSFYHIEDNILEDAQEKDRLSRQLALTSSPSYSYYKEV